MVHNAHDPEDTTHYMLSRMTLPDYPVAMGVIRAVKNPVYESVLFDQMNEKKTSSPIKKMDDLMKSGNVFEINES
jgi:2-oxoglutarate ferredoxin oxidoreductase subunit beta